MSQAQLLLIALALLLVVAGLALLWWYRQPVKKRRSAKDHHLAALEALADGDDERALAELSKAVQEGQGGLDALLRLGDMYRAKGQIKKAIHLHKTLEIRGEWPRPQRARILSSIADDFLAAGRWNEALVQLEELRKLDPENPAVARRVSQAQLRKGELEKAQTALRRAHKLEGKDQGDEMAILLAEGARHQVQEQRWKEARKALGDAFKLDGACLPALRVSADLYHREGQDQKAADELQKLALTALPGSEIEYPRMEKLFFDLGRFHEIQFVYQEVLSKEPGFWPARFALAEILDKRGSREDAVRLLDPVHQAGRDEAVKAAGRLLDWDREDMAREWLSKIGEKHSTGEGIYRCRYCGTEHPGPRWYCPTCHGFKSYEPLARESASAAHS